MAFGLEYLVYLLTIDTLFVVGIQTPFFEERW